ncbi:unnamed protein product, partial [Iphiclides podalirius]
MKKSDCKRAYWMSQLTCDNPEPALVGVSCGFSRCDCPDPMEASSIGSTSLLVAICSVVGFFTFVTPLLLHLVTKKYVTDIHYDPETSTYKAVTYNFFLVPKKLEFKPNDVVVPDIPGMFTTMKAKGTPLFIEARHFNDPLHYAKIMGYDKPMDFKLGNVEDSESNAKKVLW